LSRSALAILALAALFSFGLWLSMRGASLEEVELLPARCRRRVHWWQRNARYAQLGCVVVAIAGVCLQVSAAVE
jgi:hypothetical protein